MSDETGYKIAETLDENAEWIICSLVSERAKIPEADEVGRSTFHLVRQGLV